MKQVLLLLILFFTIVLNAQPPKKFYHRFGGNGYDVGNDVKQTLDGGYIITGSTSSFGQGNTDMYLYKMDSLGQKKFETSFGGYNNETAKNIVLLADSGFVMVGHTASSGFGGYDIYLVKADKNGAFVWQKTIGGTDWDFAYSMDTTADGGFIIAGTTYSYGRGNADGYIVKTDANGNVAWSKTYGGKKDDEFKSVIQTSDGNYALTGYTKSYNDSIGDAWIFKVDMNGDSLWCKFYGGNKEDFGNGIIQLQNSQIYISGGSKSSSASGNTETLLSTYDLITGNAIFSYADVSNQEEYYNHCVQGVNGSIANCGRTKNVTFGYDALIDIYSDVYGVVNFFSKGTTLYEEFYSVSTTTDRGFVAVGKTTGYDAILDDVFFMKMDSTGSFGSSIIGIEENEFNKIEPQIFPNPSSSVFSIYVKDFDNYKSLSYQLIDINGNLLKADKLSNNKAKIDITALSDGFYILQIFEKNKLVNTSKLSVIK